MLLACSSKLEGSDCAITYLEFGRTAEPEPSTGTKRRSPLEPPSQPAAKKRLIKQSSSALTAEPMSAASDAESMGEIVSPRRKNRKRLIESDDDTDEDFVPGESCAVCCI